MTATILNYLEYNKYLDLISFYTITGKLVDNYQYWDEQSRQWLYVIFHK